MSGRVNYNVCCPGMDQILGTYVPEAEWAPKARMPAGAADRDPYPAGEYNARLRERAEKEWSRLSSSRARSWRWSSGKILFFILIVSRATRR